jgi:hypothetical protein
MPHFFEKLLECYEEIGLIVQSFVDPTLQYLLPLNVAVEWLALLIQP